MEHKIFEDIYKSAGIPVIICENNEDMTISFANTEARLLLNPTLAVEMLGDGSMSRVPFKQIMRFNNASEQNNFYQAVRNTGSLHRYSTTIFSAKNVAMSVNLSANTVQLGDDGYIVIYVFNEGNNPDNENNDILSSVLNTTYHATDIDQAVRLILSSIGDYINVSRVYIFEDLFNNYVRNTYEWCAPGVEPVIDTLQNICKDDYHHNVIINPSGLYIANDVSDLPDIDRAVLEPQGIRAVAILPLFHQDRPIGYIGYDDCRNTRKWNHKELTLLKGVSSIVSSLIIRRNAEAEIKRQRETLQTISDNIDAIIYVNDFETYKLKFVNRALANMLGVEPAQLIGRLCWQVLQKNMDGPCPFCPIPQLLAQNGDSSGTTMEWEHQNTITGGWYWVKDSIIQWGNEKQVHFETAIDITLRKQYEKQLQHYASTDIMTGMFNREWGAKLLRHEHETARLIGNPVSLCFIDFDKLKHINDTYGHDAGDIAIKSTCEIIRRNIRKEDMICRWGGDEFIILLKCGVERAAAIMRTIQEELNSNNQKKRSLPKLLTFSYGIIDFTAADTVETAIVAADSLMYDKKNAKRE